MKSRYFLVLTLALLGSRANAQVPPSPTDGTPTVVEAGPHHRVWQRVTVDDQGRTNVSSFTELATGLNFWNSTTGRWQASQEDFDLTQPGYAIARKTQHQVTVAGNQNTSVAIDWTTHDKQHFQCHIFGLAYEDAASGTNTLIAEVKDCVGQLVAPNQIIFPDAFTDVRADYRVTLTKAGLEADVILREQPPSPAEYGLPEETSHLQIWTEFVQAPTPTEQAALSTWGTNGVPNRFLIGPNHLTDERLSFGAMAFGQGRAFSLGTRPSATVNLGESQVPVGKTWANIQDRHFLIESVNYLSIRPHVAALPAAVSRQASIRRSKARRVAMNARELKLPKTRKSRAAAIRVAKADLNTQPGFVVDWVLLNSAANRTLQGDTTYYISGTTILSGVTTIEAGAVVKYTNGAQVKIQGTLNCLTAPYRPAIFTAKDDDTVGETISGSTGNPGTNYYASTALFIDNNQSDLHNVRISYATQALYYDYDTGYPHSLSHSQLVHCQQGIVPLNTTFWLRNVLMYDVKTNFYAASYYATGRVEHLTVDVADVMNGSTNISLYLTNSLLVGVTTLGPYTGAYTQTSSSGASVFQTVGAGSHYLADNTYRNAGATNISYQLQAELQRLTTYPPLVLTNTVAVATTLSPQAQRDTDTPDLGYHYDSIDYAINTLTVTNTTLTLTNGVALATFGNTGIWLTDGSQLFSEGAPMNHNHLTRYYNVQERSTNWGGGSVSGTITINPYNYGVAPANAQLRFTDFDGVAVSGYHLYTGSSWTLNSLLLQDCSFNSASLQLDGPATTVFGVTNNLFERVASQIQGSPQITVYNSLYRYGSIYTVNAGLNNWIFQDDVFDNTSITDFGNPVTAAYNAYINIGTSRFYPTNSNDKILTSFIYTNGPLGRYCQASTNLYDMGSRNATNAGLYHYSVRLDQTKETNSTVDIGFHYAAVNPAEAELSKSGMSTASSSSYDTTWTNTTVINGLLGDPGWANSIWTEEPAWLRVDLGSSQNINHVGYISRDGTANNFNGGGSNGAYQQYKLYVTDSSSTNPADWGSEVANGQWLWPNGKERRDLIFNPTTGRYVIFRRITASGYGTPPGYANVNEVWIYKRNSMFSTSIDTDGDGIPDYLEDRNGNGSVDTGETDWQTSNSGISGAAGLSVFTPLK